MRTSTMDGKNETSRRRKGSSGIPCTEVEANTKSKKRRLANGSPAAGAAPMPLLPEPSLSSNFDTSQSPIPSLTFPQQTYRTEADNSNSEPFPPPDLIAILEHLLCTGSVARAARVRYNTLQTCIFGTSVSLPHGQGSGSATSIDGGTNGTSLSSQHGQKRAAVTWNEVEAAIKAKKCQDTDKMSQNNGKTKKRRATGKRSRNNVSAKKHQDTETRSRNNVDGGIVANLTMRTDTSERIIDVGDDERSRDDPAGKSASTLVSMADVEKSRLASLVSMTDRIKQPATIAAGGELAATSSTSAEQCNNTRPDTPKVSKACGGVWPSIQLPFAIRGGESQGRRAENDSAASFAAALATDDHWGEDFGDMNTIASESSQGPASPSVGAPSSNDAILGLLIDRCWQRAVHTVGSLVPYSPLDTSRIHLPLQQRSSEEENRTSDTHSNEDDLQMVNSILEREAMFIIDSLLHLVLAGGKETVEQGKSNAGSDTSNVPLNWKDIIKFLSASAAKNTSPLIPSHPSLVHAFTQTVEAHPDIPPIPLNQQTLKSISMRLMEMFDPNLL